MVTINDRDTARYVATFNRTLVNNATLVRTGVTVKARLEDGLRADPIPGLPRMLRMRRMKLDLMNDPITGPPDVWAGDTVSLTNRAGKSMGTYFVMDKATPRTNAPATECYCIMMTDEMGNSAFPSNAVVTILDPVNNRSIPNVRALIYPSTPEEALSPTAVNFSWVLVLQKGLVYPGTTDEVAAGDLCDWQHFDRPEKLGERHPILEPVPAICFYMKAVSDAQR